MARLALANATDHGRGSRRCSVGPCISDDRSARAKLKDALSRRFTVAFPGTGGVWAIVMQKRQRVSQLPERQRLAATNRVAAPVSSQSWLLLNVLREADAAVGATRRPRYIWGGETGIRTRFAASGGRSAAPASARRGWLRLHKEALRLANADCRWRVDGNGAEAYAEAGRREREGPAVTWLGALHSNYD